MRFWWPLLAVWIHLSSEALVPNYSYYLDTISTCTEWYDNSGDYSCTKVRDVLGISPANFTRWNPSVTLDCQWEIHTSYCTWVASEFPIISNTTTTSSTTSSTAHTPTAKPSPSSWATVGCWPVGESDFPTLDRSLVAIPNISPSKCGDACYNTPANNYVFAGISAGSQCWCGDFVRNDMTDEINKKCDITCAGDTSQNCGGAKFINVYEAVFDHTITSTNPGPSSVTSTSTSSSIVTSRSSTTSSTTSTRTTSKTTAGPTTTASPPEGTGQPISVDGICGFNGRTCIGSTFGNCCSKNFYCGSTLDHCAVSNGCLASFGTCQAVTEDGICGFNGRTCLGGKFGNCCGKNFLCGSNTDSCSVSGGCLSAFGTCQAVTQDGICGFNGRTCIGGNFGNCCSKNFYCGSTTAYCAPKECLPIFGNCNAS